ncbi:hexose kinase [Kineosporia sp. J2-2]|uniref:Hexose kinase n=1 Tax=Kineosporia corallincola TaxID=2835133 RepID=A0ABS5TDJ5_9ACTN|nr:hexose kinase [Kineosporia corallincola]MBT0769162.1 hexose kinase [Kineosporia corallincola]
MARLIVVTPNPAVDVTYHVPPFDAGDSVRVSGVSRRPGGKGLNVVRVLRALGEPSVAVLPLGGSPGRWISSMMDDEELPCEVVAVTGETRSTVAVVEPAGHPTLFNEPGPELSAAEGEALIAATVRHCEPGGVVVVAGSLPPGIGPGWIVRLVVAVQEAGAQVLADTSGSALLAAARAGADLLKPNAAEAIEAAGWEAPAALGHPTGRENSAGREDSAGEGTRLRDAVALLQRLGARDVVVSRGADGLIAFGPDGSVVEQAAVRGVTGNPTGAGDAATAGLALARVRGEPTAVGLRRAAALGAAAVLRPTAGEVDPGQVRVFEERLRSGQ